MDLDTEKTREMHNLYKEEECKKGIFTLIITILLQFLRHLSKKIIMSYHVPIGPSSVYDNFYAKDAAKPFWPQKFYLVKRRRSYPPKYRDCRKQHVLYRNNNYICRGSTGCRPDSRRTF
ncbi:hypothetical protein ALC57_11043 [Trachymyrmex cornetzi]|uniref:Uncharacterized protein n=1 Tax=Trachymyrmex cornetzi TaxID=471704 RepID=A0A151J388_9HYME|nr:hypothetical protein ALC57_11043 [Trachymyrmex cornetzi]